MKNVRFIAPIESMSGNLSGKQDLLYPTKNNKAWESPSDKRNYATNYRPRYVGTFRAKDGRVSFAIKRKSAITLSPLMRKQQALIGGAKVVCDFIMHDGAHIQELQTRYMRSQIYREGGSFYKYINESVRYSLSTKLAGIFFNGDPGQSAIIYQNPWISTTAPGTPVAVTIPADILAKFWMQLANSPISLLVSGLTIVAHSGDSWDDVAASAYNVANLNAHAQYIIVGSASGSAALFIGTMSGDVFTKELSNATISADTQYTASWDSL